MKLARFRLLLSVFIFLLIGCSAAPPPTPTPIFALPTQVIIVVATDSAPTTPVAANPTDLAATPPATLPLPTGAPPAANATPPAVSTLAAGIMRVKIFLVALNDAGKTGKKIGCDDSIIGVDRAIPITQGVMNAALNELFSMHDKNLGTLGLYNALYQSTLKVDGINLVSGKATIQISGKLTRGGVCDDPRVKAQIEETALQFPTVKSVAVFINGVPIDKALSEK
jgi:hypothetical protein